VKIQNRNLGLIGFEPYWIWGWAKMGMKKIVKKKKLWI